MAAITIEGDHIQASDNSKVNHSINLDLERYNLPNRTSVEEYVVKASTSTTGISDFYIEVTPYVKAAIDGKVFKSMDFQEYGYVNSHYSGTTSLTVMVDTDCDYTPVAGDIIACATDHNGSNKDYEQIALVVDTNAPIYVLTLDAALSNNYPAGSPVVFNPWPRSNIDYDRYYQGIATQLNRPAAITGGAYVSGTDTLSWTASTDDVVKYEGSIMVWVSDSAFTAENWTRIDGYYPDKIVAGTATSVSSFTTMNGGEAIGTGTRYFLPLACSNITSTEAAASGIFDAILGSWPASSISGTKT